MKDDVKRLGVTARTRMIEEAIRAVAAQKGIYAFTAQDVADACPVPTSKGTVLRYFHTLEDMRKVVT